MPISQTTAWLLLRITAVIPVEMSGLGAKLRKVPSDGNCLKSHVVSTNCNNKIKKQILTLHDMCDHESQNHIYTKWEIDLGGKSTLVGIWSVWHIFSESLVRWTREPDFPLSRQTGTDRRRFGLPALGRSDTILPWAHWSRWIPWRNSWGGGKLLSGFR